MQIEKIKEQVEDLSRVFNFNKKPVKEVIFLSLVKLNEALEDKSTRITQLNNDVSKEKEAHATLAEKNIFVSSLLGANPNFNEGLSEFRKIVKEEFFPFANKERTLANEAEMILKLQEIETELSAVVAFPDLYSRNTVAIGGGFSSGKSQFISSFFVNDDITLPIGIEPVTAIPTYVISEPRNQIKGYSSKGGLVEISEALYEKLSHEFIKTLGFNIKDIMPFMMMGTPLNKDYFENICLIDTPGYNPAVTDGYTDADKNTSAGYIENANSLLWLIGLDSNGTIPASDLEFLDDLDMEGKKLYIVANKADLRSQEDLEDILEIIEESLDDYDIACEGISAYSANSKQEYYYLGKSLFEFLESENKTVKTQDKLILKVYDICNMYKKAILNSMAYSKAINNALNTIELDMIEGSFDNNNVFSKLSALKKISNDSEDKKNLKELEVLRVKFKESIDEIFGNVCDVEDETDFSVEDMNFFENIIFEEDIEELPEPKRRKTKKKVDDDIPYYKH